MSNGPNNVEITTVIKLEEEEFQNVCKRVNNLLVNRVNKAFEKSAKCPTDKSRNNSIEVSKDAFAFIHLLELVEFMSVEICELREALGVSGDDVEGYVNVADSVTKKQYPN